MQLHGTKVLLTGATGGIGNAIARAVFARGGQLVLTGRRSEALTPLAKELGAHAVSCDLADRQALDALIAESRDVDVLIANAAHPASGVFTEFDQSRIDHMLEVNLRAPIALARALAPGMIERRRGHLVFISSLAGKIASPASSIYSATKFGLRGFALGAREDLHPHDVGVSVVLPGFIRDAGMFADAGVELPRAVGTRTPEQVADAVVAAIERNRAEVQVAPMPLRLGASFGSMAPALASALSRRMGSDKIATEVASGQRAKR